MSPHHGQPLTAWVAWPKSHQAEGQVYLSCLDLSGTLMASVLILPLLTSREEKHEHKPARAAHVFCLPDGCALNVFALQLWLCNAQGLLTCLPCFLAWILNLSPSKMLPKIRTFYLVWAFGQIR